MKIFIVSPGMDTCGQGARIAAAFRKYSDWDVRAMRTDGKRWHYPHDLDWDPVQAQRLYDQADAVHHQISVRLYAQLDHGQQKPTLVHHHGTRLRGHPEAVAREGLSIGAGQIVSTVDLLDDCPDATWLPQPCDLEFMRGYRSGRKNRRIRIGHAPTNRAAKNTTAILSALNRLSKRHDIEVDLIEGVEWKVCLSRKARCDIFIDQLTIGYGNNAVEAMAMGIPVISGWEQETDRARFVTMTEQEPPFVEACEHDIERKLDSLIRYPSLREEWGAKGTAYAEAMHADWRIVERLKAIYAGLGPTKGELRLFGKTTAIREPMRLTGQGRPAAIIAGLPNRKDIVRMPVSGARRVV